MLGGQPSGQTAPRPATVCRRGQLESGHGYHLCFVKASRDDSDGDRAHLIGEPSTLTMP